MAMKKVLIVIASVFTLLSGFLYWDLVIRQQVEKSMLGSIALARVDFDCLDSLQAEQAVFNLKKQQAVQAAMCMPPYKSAIFSYDVSTHHASQIVALFNASTGLNGKLFTPSAKQLKSGCPVSVQSYTYKMYCYFSNL
jgi:hypothetical protein